MSKGERAHRRRHQTPPPALADSSAGRGGRRAIVLVNAAARSTGDRAVIAAAARTIGRRYSVEVVSPASAAELHRSARASAEAGIAVMVAGGDGTLHKVINALDGLDAPIGVLPLGTGNDFARALGLPTDTAAAARRILEGQIRQMDLVAVNGRLFCTVGVLGLAAEATLAFDRLQRPGAWSRPLMRALGGWSYRIAALQALLSRGSRLERMAIDAVGSPHGGIGVEAEPRPVFGVFVTNTTLLGGGMNLPIDSDVADGRLEIACIEAMSRARLFLAFLSLANGWRLPDGVLRVVQTDRAVIACGRRLPFAADGERICDDSRFDVVVRPGALHVIC